MNELELFANELLGTQKFSSNNTETNGNLLKLSINDVNANKEKKKVSFDPIDVNVDSSRLSALIQDICFEPEDNNPRDDLLDLIEENGNK